MAPIYQIWNDLCISWKRESFEYDVIYDVFYLKKLLLTKCSPFHMNEVIINQNIWEGVFICMFSSMLGIQFWYMSEQIKRNYSNFIWHKIDFFFFSHNTQNYKFWTIKKELNYTLLEFNRKKCFTSHPKLQLRHVSWHIESKWYFFKHIPDMLIQ